MGVPGPLNPSRFSESDRQGQLGANSLPYPTPSSTAACGSGSGTPTRDLGTRNGLGPGQAGGQEEGLGVGGWHGAPPVASSIWAADKGQASLPSEDLPAGHARSALVTSSSMKWGHQILGDQAQPGELPYPASLTRGHWEASPGGAVVGGYNLGTESKDSAGPCSRPGPLPLSPLALYCSLFPSDLSLMKNRKTEMVGAGMLPEQDKDFQLGPAGGGWGWASAGPGDPFPAIPDGPPGPGTGGSASHHLWV